MNKRLLRVAGFLILVLLLLGIYYGAKSYSGRIKSTAVQEKEAIKIEQETGRAVNVVNHGLAKVAVYNGTPKIGLSGNFSKKMDESMEMDIVAKENAFKNDYPRSFVVDVNAQRTDLAKKIEDKLGAPLVSIMPDKEATPSADILVILGADFK